MYTQNVFFFSINSGDIDVRLTCDDFKEKQERVDQILEQLEHESKPCKCKKIEEYMRQMIENAYSKITMPEEGLVSREQYEQFLLERHETDKMVHNSLQVLCSIKCFCKYGRTVQDVFAGSVVIRLHCPNFDALLDLWHSYKLGDMQEELQKALVTQEMLDKFKCDSITIKVNIDYDAFLECKKDLGEFTNVVRATKIR